MIRVFSLILLAGSLLFSSLYPSGCSKDTAISGGGAGGAGPSKTDAGTEEPPPSGDSGGDSTSSGGSTSPGGTGSGGSESGPPCVPKTCAGLGKNCGAVDDGCGHPLDCGSCLFGMLCGGEGTPNVCVADPLAQKFDQYAFVSNRGGNANLHLADTSGQPAQPLTAFAYPLPPPPPPPPPALPPRPAAPGAPSFSPDGLKIGYTMTGDFNGESHFDLSILNVLEAQATPPALYTPWLDSGGNKILGARPSWNPNDGAAVFVTQEAVGGCSLKKVGADKIVSDELKNTALAGEKWNFGGLAVSPVKDPAHPSFQKIIFAFSKTTTGSQDLRLKQYGDTSFLNTILLTNTTMSETNPAFSPDGAKVVFDGVDGTSQQIWIGDFSSSPPSLVKLVQLTSAGKNSFPCITKNGKILFVSDRDGNKEIYSMNLDGTNQRNETNNGADDFDVACGPTVYIRP